MFVGDVYTKIVVWELCDLQEAKSISNRYAM